MPDDLAPPGAALALVLALVFGAATLSILRGRQSPDHCIATCIVVLVLALTMAASVVAFSPLQAGDLVEERQRP